MDKSKLLLNNIYNLTKSGVWSVDYAEYQAISWNSKGLLKEDDFNELIEKLEKLRTVENEVDEEISTDLEENSINFEDKEESE